MPNCQNVKMSNCQNAKLSKCQIVQLKLSKCQQCQQCQQCQKVKISKSPNVNNVKLSTIWNCQQCEIVKHAIATSFFYIYVIATSFFYIYIDIYIHNYTKELKLMWEVVSPPPPTPSQLARTGSQSPSLLLPSPSTSQWLPSPHSLSKYIYTRHFLAQRDKKACQACFGTCWFN